MLWSGMNFSCVEHPTAGINYQSRCMKTAMIRTGSVAPGADQHMDM
jgi:hypothetical protein